MEIGDRKHSAHAFGFSAKAKAYLAAWDPSNRTEHIRHMEVAIFRSEGVVNVMSQGILPHIEYHNSVSAVHAWLLDGQYDNAREHADRLLQLDAGKSPQPRHISTFVDLVRGGDYNGAIRLLTTAPKSFYMPVAEVILRKIPRKAGMRGG